MIGILINLLAMFACFFTVCVSSDKAGIVFFTILGTLNWVCALYLIDQEYV